MILVSCVWKNKGLCIWEGIWGELEMDKGEWMVDGVSIIFYMKFLKRNKKDKMENWELYILRYSRF